MKLSTFQYIEGSGWTVDAFPACNNKNTLVIVFSSPQFINDDTCIKELSNFYSNAHIIGCSSAGEISDSQVHDHSLSVAVLSFQNTTINTAEVNVSAPEDSYHAGVKIASTLYRDNLRSIFVLSDGLKINGTMLAEGLNSLNNNHVIITGGLAGDGDQFKQTWVIHNGEIKTGYVVAVGLYGDSIHITHGSKGGWDIFGPERLVTRSEGNILYELDGRPALDLYKEYLGDKAKDLPASGLLFPLAIRKDKSDSYQLVRTILSIDEKNRSLIFAGDIPTGYYAQLMRANFDRLIDGATNAGCDAVKGLSDNRSDTLLLAVSCVGRRLLLGERVDEEVESTIETFPEGTKQIGFYSYGELSPYTSGKCDLHNQTMTLTSISEVI